MDDDLRARIAGALAAAGIIGFKDTTTGIRPQWRASFSFRGKLHGETSYVHIYVPASADQLQVNCSAPASSLDPMSAQQLQGEMARFSTSHAAGSAELASMLGELGATPADISGWETAMRPYMGMRHRMVLASVKMSLASLSGSSLDLAIRLGLKLARAARDSLAADLR
ncbi:MAG: hypothetical protein ACOX87_07635 [Chloroflexota bacterium]|jgi:hypothetical protein